MNIEIEETLEDHLKSGYPSTDPQYFAWKAREILEALEETKDRSKMIPAHKIWKEFGLEH